MTIKRNRIANCVWISTYLNQSTLSAVHICVLLCLYCYTPFVWNCKWNHNRCKNCRDKCMWWMVGTSTRSVRCEWQRKRSHKCIWTTVELRVVSSFVFFFLILKYYRTLSSLLSATFYCNCKFKESFHLVLFCSPYD